MVRKYSVQGLGILKETENATEEVENNDIEKMSVQEYNEIELRLKYPARVRIAGPVSGQLYEVQKAGDTFFALKEDVEGLLSRRIGDGPCCGGQMSENYLFELV